MHFAKGQAYRPMDLPMRETEEGEERGRGKKASVDTFLCITALKKGSARGKKSRLHDGVVATCCPLKRETGGGILYLRHSFTY